MAATLPGGTIVAFYGDDFTGSTATLEAMVFAGLKSILFFGHSDDGFLSEAAAYQVVGIAGLSRSKPPAWMDTHLPQAFAALRATNPSLLHYKICSTFDSAPHVGSIGKAIEIGATLSGNDWTPVFTAVPQIARWQAFGNLFAGSGGSIYRIDRHPVMMRHPVTPMKEADPRFHLAQQTGWQIGLIDLVDLKSGTEEKKIARELADGARILLVDAIDEQTLCAAGRVIWNGRAERSFVAGSQGVEYALLAHWTAQRLLQLSATPPPPKKVDRIAIVSGSCSPVTARQIMHAGQNGCDPIPLATHLAADARSWQAELQRALAEGLTALRRGRSPLIYSALGPDDPEVTRLTAAMAATAGAQEHMSARIGEGLGSLLDDLVRQEGLTRAVVSGGDSSGQACLAMGIAAVTALAPISAGAPLCLARSRKKHLDGLEIALKGGQVGAPDFFSRAKGEA